MRLFIAEKPSLAKAIAAVIPGQHKSSRECIECADGTVITWCFGHLLKQADPHAYGQQYKSWSFANLPILPEKWILEEVESSRNQVAVIKRLLTKATEVVNAGDADREGQLLVDELLEYLGNRKPVQRLWAAATDPTNMKRALAAMKPNSEYRNLCRSALARSRADWLVGMNLSRAYTCAARDEGGNGPTVSVGRVQTPTLKLVVDRDNEIANFVPKDYYVPEAEIATAKGNFMARWKTPDGTKVDDEGRILDVAVVNALKQRVEASPNGQISLCESTDEKTPAPLPFSLSSLQAYANKRWGYGAQEVLDGAQALYETHSLTSYPRVDSEFLPEAQLSDATQILGNLTGAFAPAGKADASLKSRAWNDKKITAHFAIIPTLKKPGPLSSLPELERNLYEAICLRYIAQFYPDYRYRKTVIEAAVGPDVFRATGSVPTFPGWKAVYGLTGEEDDAAGDEQKLPAVTQGDAARVQSIAIRKKTTTPPDHFSEGELISAMNNVHKYVDNPDIKKRLKETAGLGTEATRAATIETLIARGFIQRQGKGKKVRLISSETGRKLIAALPMGVKDPGMTALWETALNNISQGQLELEVFITSQTGFITKLVNEARDLKLQLPYTPKPHSGGKGSFKSGSRGSSSRGGKSGGYTPRGDGAPRAKLEPAGIDCPKCGEPMVRRESRDGSKKFVGCSGYPKCTHTIWEN